MGSKIRTATEAMMLSQQFYKCSEEQDQKYTACEYFTFIAERCKTSGRSFKFMEFDMKPVMGKYGRRWEILSEDAETRKRKLASRYTPAATPCDNKTGER